MADKLGVLNKTVDSRLGRRTRDRDTLIGSSPRGLKRRYGVALRPALVNASGRTITFADGSDQQFDAVIWATGYQPDHTWINLPVLDADGRPRHRRGVTDVAGLYFPGLPWQHTRGSALLGWVRTRRRVHRHRDRLRHQHSPARRHPSLPRAGAQEGLTHEQGQQRTPATTDTQFSRQQSLGCPTPLMLTCSTSPTATPSTFGSPPSSSSSETTRCACSPTTAPSPAQPCASAKVLEPTVNVTNDADIEATVHWHGLRLDNRYDGTHETQAPIPVGGSFAYQISFPDPGHLLVPPAHPRGLRPGNGAVREHRRRARQIPTTGRRCTAKSLLTLDDVLVEDGKIGPFSRTETNYVAMGRFGTLLLVGGQTDLALSALEARSSACT